MKAFGFLSFGHYADVPGSSTRTAGDMLRQTIEIAEGADEIGVNGAYVRVHHWARQAASPMPLLSAMAARTKRIEVGTGVIDMRYENPFQFAEEAAALDYIADGRIALGVSRGSPETALRGYETFGYVDGEDPERGSILAREKFDLFRAAYKEAGHTGRPRVSVSRSVFPLISDQDRAYFGLRSEENGDQIGVIDGFRSTFGKTYAAEPDVLISQLKQDEAVMAADTLMLTIPNQLGPEYNLHVLQAFAEHVAPALGWKPNTEGPVQGDPVD